MRVQSRKQQVHKKTSPRGLLLIQIDGLSRPQMERALDAGRMPFLKRLIKEYDYRLYSHYSGIPSSTPTVQGELMYGVPCAVPAFGFYNKDSGRMTSMLSMSTSLAVEKKISEGHTQLLTGGSAYADVFTGGAVRNRFCLSDAGSAGWMQGAALTLRFWIIAVYMLALLRSVVLAVVELGLSVFDFIRGMSDRLQLLKEMQFIPSRIGICILLREFVKARIMVDIAAGYPVIHGNFIAYDEQAHRRGPSSAFAHWTLRGIDYTLAVLWRIAKSSKTRVYDFWIYSDHGQEDVIPYRKLHKVDIRQVIDGAVRRVGLPGLDKSLIRNNQQHHRIGMLISRCSHTENGMETDNTDDMHVYFSGAGPLGHLYVIGKISNETRERLAHELVHSAAVPMVLWADNPHRAMVLTKDGSFVLPGQAALVLGKAHPFLDDIRYDLVRLVHHPWAGSLVLCGWSRTGEKTTFPMENGAHAGPGLNETHGFALLPHNALERKSEKGYIRPRDIRTAVLRFRSDMGLMTKQGKKPGATQREVSRPVTVWDTFCSKI